MESPGAAGRRRGNSRSNVEDQALDQIAKEVSLELFICAPYFETMLFLKLNITAFHLFICNTQKIK